MSRAVERIEVVDAGATGSVDGVALHETGFETTLVDASTTLVDQIGRAGVTVVQVDEGRSSCA